MIPVLLVEDEELEMKNLQNAINYDELGLNIVGLAFNGEDALRIIDEKQPLIVITDIVMPKISGIEIARRIKLSGGHAKVIILTGHQRFDYAKLALECGVVDYLVKPVLPEHLKTLLEKVVRECTEMKKRIYEEQFFKSQLESNMTLLMDHFVDELVHGVLSSEEELREKIDFYKINLQAKHIVTLLIKPEIGDQRKEYCRRLSDLSMRHSVEKYLRDNHYTFCCALSGDQLIVLVNLFAITGPDEIYLLADSLRCSIQADCGVSATIGAGTVVNGFNEIPVSVSAAVQALEHRFFLGNGQVITFDDISGADIQPSMTIRRFLPHILNAVKAGDTEKIKQWMQELSDVAIKSQIPPAYLRVFFIELLSTVTVSQYELGDPCNLPDESDYYLNILAATTLECMVSWTQEILLSLCMKRLNRVNNREMHLVKRITEIINEQYAKDIFMENIASQVCISAGYAAKLFKKINGKSVNTYLTEIRMRHAADMLKNPDTTIGDVADQVGYSNIAYFSSVFRKLYNCTPREYRDSHTSTN